MAQSPAFATATAESPAPDGAQSPPPQGIHGDLENEMLGLANALYNLGTTVVLDSTKEKQNLRPGENPPAKPVAQKVNEVIGHLANIEELSTGYDTMIPFQILQDVDNARNPMFLTKDRLERAATENQFMNGKIRAIESYRRLLDASLSEAYPEIAPYLPSMDEPTQSTLNASTSGT